MHDAVLHSLRAAGIGLFEYELPASSNDGDRTFAHDYPERRSGLTDSEVLSLLHPDDRKFVVEAVEGLDRDGGVLHVECRAVSQTGEVRYLRLHGRADAESGKVHGVVIDESRQRIAEQAALEADQKLLDLIETVPAAVIMFDEHLMIQAINSELAEALGVEASDFAGKSLFEAMPIGNGSDFEHIYRSAVQSREPVRAEFFFTPFQEWFDMAIVPVTTGFISYTQSSQEKKENEALVKEQEKQLVQGEKMRIIGQLSGSIAHDFNNQLAAVLGYADLLRTQLDDDRLRSFADRIVSAAERASVASRRILSFGDEGSGTHEEIDLTDIALGVVELLSLSQRCSIRFAGNPGVKQVVTGDASQVQGAILNLVLNGRDAVADDGVVSVSVDVIELESSIVGHRGSSVGPGTTSRISVTDTGPGMAPELLAEAFEQSVSTKGPGRGYGLSLVYGVAQEHNGTVVVTSSPEAGTRADIYLPADRAEDGVVTPRRHDPGEVGVSEVRSATVLVVEDNELVGGLALEGLTSLGLNTIRARSGEEAMQAFLRHGSSIDLVYLDWIMPGMPGSEVLRQLKALKPELPVIIASGLMTARASSQDSPADGFLGKPFTLEQLKAAIIQAQ